MALYSAGSRLGLKARAQGFGPRLIPALHFNLAASPQFLKNLELSFFLNKKNERTPEAKLVQKPKKGFKAAEGKVETEQRVEMDQDNFGIRPVGRFGSLAILLS